MEFQGFELTLSLSGRYNLEPLTTYITNLKIHFNQTLFLLFSNGTEKTKLNLLYLAIHQQSKLSALMCCSWRVSLLSTFTNKEGTLQLSKYWQIKSHNSLLNCQAIIVLYFMESQAMIKEFSMPFLWSIMKNNLTFIKQSGYF